MKRLLWVGFLALPRLALADESPVEVRVIGNKADSLQKVPGSGTLVTDKEIQRAAPRDAAEVLRRVPGVHVRQDEGAGLRLDIGMRGLDPGRSRRVLVLEDGIPVAINPYAEPDLYYQPPIERMRGIEVVKGSGSILFGPQTTGGVINFLTLAPPSRTTAAVDMQVGEFGYARALGTYGDSHGTTRYLVSAFHKRGDGFRDTPFSSTDVFAKLAFETSSRGELTVKFGVHDDRAVGDDVGLTRDMFASDPRRKTLAPSNRLSLQRYELSLLHEERFSKNAKLRTLAYAYTTERLWLRQGYSRVPDPAEAYERVTGDLSLPSGALFFRQDNTILDRDYAVLGFEPRAELRAKMGSFEHTFDVGARLLVETAHYEQRAGENKDSTAGSLLLSEDHRTVAVAAYAQDRVLVRDNFLITPGLRVEHAAFRRELGRQVGARGAEDTRIRGDTSSTAVIPGMGAVWGSKTAHLFGGLHVGYAPPRLTSAVNPRGEDLTLRPERGIHYEAGTRASYGKLARFEGTFFLSNFQNQVIAAAGEFGTELVNGGNTQTRGMEAAASYALGAAVKSRVGIDVGARYTFAHASFVGGPNDERRLPYSPLHTGSVTADLEHPTGFALQGAMTYVGAHYTDPENTHTADATGRYGEIPGYAIFDAGLRYRHKPSGLTARLLAKNLLDQVYLASRRPEGIFAAGFRQILLSLRWDYPGGP